MKPSPRKTVSEAQARAYRAVDLIQWPEGFCRRDIGWQAVQREQGKSIYPEYNRRGADRWARPGMSVIFRAELMPGRSRAERTYRVDEILLSGRVILEDFTGDHAESEFEPVKFEG